MERTSEVSNPMFERAEIKSVADASVVVMKFVKANGAKESNGLVIEFLHNQSTGG